MSQFEVDEACLLAQVAGRFAEQGELRQIGAR
jgi:hypothetical protein